MADISDRLNALIDKIMALRAEETFSLQEGMPIRDIRRRIKRAEASFDRLKAKKYG